MSSSVCPAFKKSLKLKLISLLHFVLGGARSGKSRFAENLAAGFEEKGRTVIYLATANRTFQDEKGESQLDKEMAQRVEHHLSQRPDHWQTVECPLELSECLNRYNSHEYCILVDCLTLWFLNTLQSRTDTDNAEQALLEVMQAHRAELILVSNEVGLGIVPLGELSRRYVDGLGRLHQKVAEQADKVSFLVAGIETKLKQ